MGVVHITVAEKAVRVAVLCIGLIAVIGCFLLLPFFEHMAQKACGNDAAGTYVFRLGFGFGFSVAGAVFLLIMGGFKSWRDIHTARGSGTSP